jgi:xanthine dehydrogenase accessory factor
MGASHQEISNILAAIEASKLPLEQMALATVVDVEGSAYRRIGARMLILENGNWIGSISGGCLEGNALRIAREVMRTGVPRLITYDTRTDENAKILGASLGCNGIIEVWIKPMANSEALPILLTLKQAFLGKSESWLMRELLVNGLADGRWKLLGTSDDDPDIFSEGDGQELLAQPGVQILQSGLFTVQVFVECVTPATRLLVFGGGEDARPLVQLAAQLGWRVTVTDDCAAKVLPIRFPEADNVQQLTRETAVSSLKPDRFTAAVLMSHNYGYDKAILLEMISTNVSYIGLLGPRKRFDRMNAELGGVLDGIETIHAPIGLDIGAQTPLEIAIAVIAEIQAVFARRNAGFLKSREGFIHDRKEILA